MESNRQDHELHWTARTAPGGLVVQAFGLVDAHNEATWQRMLVESAATAAEDSILVIDGRSLDFMSCGALVALTKQAVDSLQQRVAVRLVTTQSSIRRIIVECGMEDAIPAYPDVDSALKGDCPP